MITIEDIYVDVESAEPAKLVEFTFDGDGCTYTSRLTDYLLFDDDDACFRSFDDDTKVLLIYALEAYLRRPRISILHMK